ncbi:MAG: glycosyltransferase family 39 protein [Chitinophagales bacterium]|nr:glycosyltransferase family 39 protein [Chitinophagales bacterium]
MIDRIKFLKVDILWILLFFFMLRLYGIDLPALETMHNWRQTCVLMVSQNFFDLDWRIWLPRVDFAGNLSGITPMEFPLLNILIAGSYEIFGENHISGRLINLFVTSLGLYAYFLLVRNHFTPKIAYLSTIILSVSIWFIFARKSMPDTFAASLVMISLYYYDAYIRLSQSKFLVLGFFFGLFGMLSKLPMAYGFCLLLLYLPKCSEHKKSIFLLYFTAIVMSMPSFYWYFHWNGHLLETYKFSHYFLGMSLKQGFSELVGHWRFVLLRFMEDAMKYIGFFLYLFGISLAISKKNKKLLAILVLTSLSFLVIMLKGGHFFSLQNYYIIPYVPVMALFVGYGLNHIDKKWLFYSLFFIVIFENLLNHVHDFRINPDLAVVLDARKELDLIAHQKDLILVNSGDNPSPIYFLGHKGWLAHSYEFEQEHYLDSLANLGLSYIVILNKGFGTSVQPNRGNLLIKRQEYSIYQLPKLK